MIGLDTNCLLRYLLRDDDRQAHRVAATLVKAVEQGKAVFINDIVLAEVLWVLRSSYRFDRPKIVRAVEQLTGSSHFAFEHKADVLTALQQFKSGEAGFADCLIGAKNRRLGCETTYSFDKAAQWLPTFSAV
jgi:predicted nucleic-acid-binding protein